MDAYANLDKITAGTKTDYNLDEFEASCYAALDDDLNSPIVIAQLFDAAKAINSALAGLLSFTADDIKRMKALFDQFAFDILGLIPENSASSKSNEALDGVVSLLLKLRAEAKANKDFASSDRIRNELQNLGFIVKDGKDGATWELK